MNDALRQESALNPRQVELRVRRHARRQRIAPSTAHYLEALAVQPSAAAARLRGAGLKAEHLPVLLEEATREAPATLARFLERLQAQNGEGDRSLQVLDALLQDSACAAVKGLRRLSIAPEALREPPATVRTLPPAPRLLRPRNLQPASPVSAPPITLRPLAKRQTTHPLSLDAEAAPLLSKLGRNLSLEAAEGWLEVEALRDDLLQRIEETLAKRYARNPLLVGAPGVGKTSLVEALALRWCGRAEAPLLIEIPIAALSAGASVRGALAERLRRLLKEVRALKRPVVLFMDEIHALMGATEGADEALAELKRALGRGELALIGATTGEEYGRCLEPDAALTRRFTHIEVPEPDAAAALALTQRVAAQLGDHHGVHFLPEAIEASLRLTNRYLTRRSQPEKALSTLDLAGARVASRGAASVALADVAAVVAELSDVPVERLLETDAARLRHIEAALAAELVGHADTWDAIGRTLRRHYAGLGARRGPATLLALGPSGCGKTRAAHVLAAHLFGAGRMTRIDMSELSEAQSVARLIGAPPGYVGHEQGGVLSEALRRQPYQLILLDEIEKAHPQVQLALLGLLDEGRLRDGRGRLIEAREAVILMTSNLGAEQGSETRRRVGFGAAGSAHFDTEAMSEAARKALPAELWNRFDTVLSFAPLSQQALRDYATRRLEELAAELRARTQQAVRIAATAAEALVEASEGVDELGIRALERSFSQYVESWVCERLLSETATSEPWLLDVQR